MQRAVRRWGVLRFPISASAWRARARHVQLQRAPATCAPQWSTLSELKTASRTLALERKRPVKNPSTPATPSTPSTPHPKLGNVPTQTVHRMHVPFDCCTQALRIHVFTGGAGTHARETGHTRAHTGTRMQRCTDHTDEPHNHPNPPTLHQRTHTHDDRNRQQPQP